MSYRVLAYSVLLVLLAGAAFTVQAATGTQVFIETAAYDSGTGSVAHDQNLLSGNSITLFAISRDDGFGFVQNVAASWTMTPNGNVVDGDFVVSPDTQSAVFTGNGTGTALIQITSPGLNPYNTVMFSVIVEAATQVLVETAANGSGSAVLAQNLAVGNSITLFAISRDGAGRFKENVQAIWVITSSSGGVMQADDLIVSPDQKSAVFTGHATGTAVIQAGSPGLNPTPSGMISVVPGPPVNVQVETQPDGSGGVLPNRDLTAGFSIALFAVSRDARGTFVANVTASWSFVSKSGGVAPNDLAISLDTRSAIFTGNAVGTAVLQAVSAGLTTIPSGTINVVTGPPAKVQVESKADGTGSVIADRNLMAGSSITVFAIARSETGVFVANIPASWPLSSSSGGVTGSDLAVSLDAKSAVFTGHATGTGVIQATSLNLSPNYTGNTGIITVVAGGVKQVLVETNADGSGSVVAAQELISGAKLTVFSIGRDAFGNFTANLAATWSLIKTEGVATTNLIAAPDRKSAVFTAVKTGTAQIKAVFGTLISVNSGVLTVLPSAPVKVLVETMADGSGVTVPAQIIISGTSLEVFAISRDVAGNFTGNVSATWTLINKLRGVAASDLMVASDGKSAVFTALHAGSGQINVAASLLAGGNSGTITVNAGAAALFAVETRADGNGTVVPAQTIVSGSKLVVYAVARDAVNNYTGNVAAGWSLVNLSMGVAYTDLVVALNGKSATFTGHLGGTAQIQAVADLLSPATTGIILVNNIPKAASISALPKTVSVGQPVQYLVVATDSDNDALTYTWTFDDGTNGSGASVSHAFLVKGIHKATVTITDGKGGKAISSVSVTVVAPLYPTGNPDDPGIDSDGDGFSDAFEVAAGTDPNNNGDTPFDNDAHATAAKAMPSKPLLSIKLNFIKLLSDSIQLSGTLPLKSQDLPLTGHEVVVDIGGFVQNFVLGKKVKSTTSTQAKFAIGAKPINGTTKFSCKISKSNLVSFFADEGMTPKAKQNSSVKVNVKVFFNNTVYQSLQRMVFTLAKGNTAGKAL